MTHRLLSLLVVLTAVGVLAGRNPAVAQGCGGCSPLGGGLPTNATLRFNLVGGLGSDERQAFLSAMRLWESELHANNSGVALEEGFGDYTVYFDDELFDSSRMGETDTNARTIRFNPRVLLWSGWFFKVALHEIGHPLGFGDVREWWGCSISSSAMFEVTTPSGALGYLSSNDQCAVTRAYKMRDESPVLLPLKGGAFRLTGPEVVFDLTGLGPELVGWPEASEDVGFLVLDRDGDNIISSGRELFGNNTPLSWDTIGLTSENGFLALAYFDEHAQGGNNDGWISSADSVYRYLRVWIDSDHSGSSTPEELHPLPTVGVVAISLSFAAANRSDSFGNKFRFRAAILIERGNHIERHFAYDVFLVHVKQY